MKNMYFYNPPTYTMSGLKTMDRVLLEFARVYEQHAVSWDWVRQFTEFLKRRQEEYIKLHPRVSPVDISCKVDPPSYHRSGESRSAQIRCGSFYVRLERIIEEHSTFMDAPLL